MKLVSLAAAALTRRFSHERVQKVRNRYLALRTRLHPVVRALYGTFDAADLRREIETRTGNSFEILMVHSSVNYLEPAYLGTPMDLVAALVDLCGEGRTLAMPAFFSGDRKLHDVGQHYRAKPVFDVRRTPSQSGLLTELFRRKKGVRQSLHPTHRISALGPLAEELTAHHHLGPTFGKGSPFDVMANHDTAVIAIAKGLDVLTQVHHAEAMLGDRFPAESHVETVPVRLVDATGAEHPYELERQIFAQPRRMERLRVLLRPEHVEIWNFHNVPMVATRAKHITEDLTAMALEGRTIYGDH